MAIETHVNKILWGIHNLIVDAEYWHTEWSDNADKLEKILKEAALTQEQRRLLEEIHSSCESSASHIRSLLVFGKDDKSVLADKLDELFSSLGTRAVESGQK